MSRRAFFGVLILIAWIFVGWLDARAAPVAPQRVQVPRPEGLRSYLRFAPSAQTAGVRPLVILLHGHLGSAAQVLGQRHSAAPLSVWLQIAEREGLVLVAPDGLRGGDGQPGWNDCRADAQDNPRSDDVGFLSEIIDREVAGGADPRRVYLMGMSNGGMMVFRYAIEQGRRIAAAATVGASMAAKSQCVESRRAVSMLIISGTADPLVPYEGGAVGFARKVTRGSVIGVEQSVAQWRAWDQLPSQPVLTEAVSHRRMEDPTRAERLVWGADPKGLQVMLLRILRGGHVEPSALERIGWAYRSVVGPQNGDIEAAEEAWRFFATKSAQASAVGTAR